MKPIVSGIAVPLLAWIAWVHAESRGVDQWAVGAAADTRAECEMLIGQAAVLSERDWRERGYAVRRIGATIEAMSPGGVMQRNAGMCLPDTIDPRGR